MPHHKRVVVLVAHRNAGPFIPVIAAALPGQVRGCIFVDAAQHHALVLLGHAQAGVDRLDHVARTVPL